MKWWYFPIAAVILLLLFSIAVRIWISNNLEGVINNDPERKYQIEYETLGIGVFWDGLTLKKLSIVPLDTGAATMVTGHVRAAEIEGVQWHSLIFNHALDIRKVTFLEPSFFITLQADSMKQKSHPASEMQQLFGDILARGKLEDFELRVGSIGIKRSQEDKTFLEVKGLSIFAQNIHTDSVMWRHIVPFYMDDLTIQWISLDYDLSPDEHLSSGAMIYNLTSSTMRLRNTKMDISGDWQSVSAKSGVQKDWFEFSFDVLTFHDLTWEDDSNKTRSLKLRKLAIEKLDLKDYRNKNVPRPVEPVKPFFAGMISKIPVPVEIDTVELKDSNISYTEMPEGKALAGTLSFSDFNATVLHLTNIPELQREFGSVTAEIRAGCNGSGSIKGILEVPYTERDAFLFKVAIDAMPLDVLNTTLHPMAGVTVRSGNLSKIDFTMDATNPLSKNRLVFDYEDLKIDILNEDDKKSGLTWVANPMLRSHNLPDQRHYRIAEYTSERNLYRGPFNFLWNSLKEGMMEIVPSGTAQTFMGGKEEHKKK